MIQKQKRLLAAIAARQTDKQIQVVCSAFEQLCFKTRIVELFLQQFSSGACIRGRVHARYAHIVLEQLERMFFNCRPIRLGWQRRRTRKREQQKGECEPFHFSDSGTLLRVLEFPPALKASRSAPAAGLRRGRSACDPRRSAINLINSPSSGELLKTPPMYAIAARSPVEKSCR